ncbi:MAG: hypothetical protein IAG13_03530, partial [Deltaproteobacteria bacterium]|nr:hypothetical protein [Nannocystaceae bacterium]
RVAAGALADASRRFAPRLIVLAVVESPGAARARELLDDYARAASGHSLLLCGPGALALAPAAGRHGIGVGDDEATLSRLLAG